jgi:Skp family chaperone for outer membrane proteins
MTKTFVLALAMGAAGVAAAQEPAPSPAAAAPRPAAGGLTRSPRIAVIDMALISSQSALGKAYASKIEALEKQIQAEGTKKQTDLTKMDVAIKTLQDELEKQGSVLSAEAADKKRQDITRKARERQAFLEDGQQELQRMKERAEGEAGGYNNEFQAKIKPHIEAVAKERNVDILLTSSVALTVNKEFDISADVIARADADKAAVASSTRPAAPRPAAAAPAATAPAATAPAATAPAPAASPSPTPNPNQ